MEKKSINSFEMKNLWIDFLFKVKSILKGKIHARIDPLEIERK